MANCGRICGELRANFAAELFVIVSDLKDMANDDNNS